MISDKIRAKVEKIKNVSVRPMFGHQCYSVEGKFFVGFSKKDTIIVRLPKDIQLKAIKTKGIIPFSHGAKAGWIEMDSKQVSSANAMKWITEGFENAKRLAEKS